MMWWVLQNEDWRDGIALLKVLFNILALRR